MFTLTYIQNVMLYSVQCTMFIIDTQTTQTAYLLSQGGLRRPKLTWHDMLRFTIGF